MVVQRWWKDSKKVVQKWCRGAEVQRCRGAEVHRYRGIEVQRCIGGDVHRRCSRAEVQSWVQGCRSGGCWNNRQDAELQSLAEVQRFCSGGAGA